MQRSNGKIIVTGGAGFIGSCLVADLNQRGESDILVVDDFDRIDKIRNLGSKKIAGLQHRDDFLIWLKHHGDSVDMIYHLGARTDTTEQDRTIFDVLNFSYSQEVWRYCTHHQIPLIYASSAATYGLGEHGYVDNHDLVDALHPLNPYGDSKHDFDRWALAQESAPPRWYGLKFFNVFGPNEYHKGRMASVILHTYRQILNTGAMKLFRSHRSDVADGQQSRDFIYVKDLLKMIGFFSQTQVPSGLYNCGTGEARTFYDLAAAVFAAMDREPLISYIDTPADIRHTYQYFTQADMTKVKQVGYTDPCLVLEDAIREYTQDYLMHEDYM